MITNSKTASSCGSIFCGCEDLASSSSGPAFAAAAWARSGHEPPVQPDRRASSRRRADICSSFQTLEGSLGASARLFRTVGLRTPKRADMSHTCSRARARGGSGSVDVLQSPTPDYWYAPLTRSIDIHRTHDKGLRGGRPR